MFVKWVFFKNEKEKECMIIKTVYLLFIVVDDFVGEPLNMVGRQLLFIHDVIIKVPQLQLFE